MTCGFLNSHKLIVVDDGSLHPQLWSLNDFLCAFFGIQIRPCQDRAFFLKFAGNHPKNGWVNLGCTAYYWIFCQTAVTLYIYIHIIIYIDIDIDTDQLFSQRGVRDWPREKEVKTESSS